LVLSSSFIPPIFKEEAEVNELFFPESKLFGQSHFGYLGKSILNDPLVDFSCKAL